MRRGDHELAIDFNCPFISEPDVTLQKFLSVGKSASNYSRYTDPVLDELFQKQSLYSSDLVLLLLWRDGQGFGAFLGETLEQNSRFCQR